MQPFFGKHKILTIDFLAIDGEVKGNHCFYVDGPIENHHWKTGLHQQVLSNAPAGIIKEFEGIQEMTKCLCKKHGLNGIFEIEFLFDGEKSYFLELNLLPGLYGIDERGLMPVLEQVLVKYLQHYDIDIQPRTDFQYSKEGQFYPPSASSLDYYIDMFGAASYTTCLTRKQSTFSETTSEAEAQSRDDADSRSVSDEARDIFLLMPTDSKWSDKARLIQHYLQKVHNVGITIVEEVPQTAGIVIALEKENLDLTSRHIKTGDSRLDALVLHDSSLYFDMDDKSQQSWRDFGSDDVPCNEIPTMNMVTATEQDVKKFVFANPSVDRVMVKPSDEAASQGQAIISTQDVQEILSYLGKSYVLQPFFGKHKILTIDFLAIDGEVKGNHCFYVDGPIENHHWKTGLHQQVLSNAPAGIIKEFEGIQEMTKCLCEKHGLNGIFEIEFLFDGEKSYFLELNLLPGLYGIDERGLMPVLEQVLVKYLQHYDIDVQPRTDFTYSSEGQFYPPSASSLEYYIEMYGGVHDEQTDERAARPRSGSTCPPSKEETITTTRTWPKAEESSSALRLHADSVSTMASEGSFY
jgi:hypothetical protein